MNVETIEDLFLRDLNRAHSMETELVDELSTLRSDAAVDALDSLREMAPREDLEEALSAQHDRAETHVERLDDAFEALSRRPGDRSTPVLDGIVREKEHFNNVVLNDEVRPPYYLGTAEEIALSKVALYSSLRRLGGHLDLPEEASRAVERNLADELESVEDLESLAGSDEVSSLLEGVVGATEFE